MDDQQKNDKTERARGLGRKNKRGDRKGKSNDSPEIPDRGLTSDTNFQRVSPFNITPVKRAHKARTCWYRRPFRLIYQYQLKEKYKKGMDRHNIKLKNVI